ncbi:MAG: hypothetical protein JO152_14400, partial [Mycobacteriaceae bacterium]|nr:hypothetical protein [Mycobacteriaceae bacterium]
GDGLAGQPLNQLCDYPRATTPQEAFEELRAAAGTLAQWRGPLRETLKAIISPPVLMRHDDPVLLVALTDVTEWLWTLGPDSKLPAPLSARNRGRSTPATTPGPPR